MVAIETVNAIQIIVLSRLLYIQEDLLVSFGVYNLKYMNGYNDLGQDWSQTHQLPTNYKRLLFNNDFLLNFQTGLVLMALSLLILLFYQVHMWRVRRSLRSSKKVSVDEFKLLKQEQEANNRFIYERIFFLVACLTFF